MFCSRCGNQMADDAQFCSNCGAKNASLEGSVNLDRNFSRDNIRNMAGDMRDNFISGVNDLGINPILFYANIALIVLGGIFTITKTLKVNSAFGVVEVESMFADSTGLKFFCIAAYIVSVILIVQPMLTQGEVSSRRFLLAKIVIIAVFIWFMIVVIGASSEIGKNGGSLVQAKLALTAAGWLYLITNIGAIVLSFKNSRDLKRL